MLTETNPRIVKTLLLLGFAPHNIGFHYLATALDMTTADPALTGRGITYILYPDVAKQYKSTASSVERGIRLAISRAWDRRVKEAWLQVFPVRLEKAPTNAHFISMLTQWLLLDLDIDINRLR